MHLFFQLLTFILFSTSYHTFSDSPCWGKNSTFLPMNNDIKKEVGYVTKIQWDKMSVLGKELLILTPSDKNGCLNKLWGASHSQGLSSDFTKF